MHALLVLGWGLLVLGSLGGIAFLAASIAEFRRTLHKDGDDHHTRCIYCNAIVPIRYTDDLCRPYEKPPARKTIFPPDAEDTPAEGAENQSRGTS